MRIFTPASLLAMRAPKERLAAYRSYAACRYPPGIAEARAGIAGPEGGAVKALR
jgi:hypothetical protein